jgi:hypothetical protein
VTETGDGQVKLAIKSQREDGPIVLCNADDPGSSAGFPCLTLPHQSNGTFSFDILLSNVSGPTTRLGGGK